MTIGSHILTHADGAHSPARLSLRRKLSAGFAAASLIAAGLSAAPAYAAPGNLDATYGNSGIAPVDFGPGTDQGLAAALQKDGKVVVVGVTDVDQSPPPAGSPAGSIGPINFDFAITRLNTDGSLDGGFGSGGKVVTGFGTQSDTPFAVALQPDGKIVVGGATIVDAAATDARFAVARFQSDGSLDPSFGTGGKIETDITPGIDGINDIAVQADGQIVAAGVSGCTNAALGRCANADTTVVRYNKNGSLDGSFGSGGKVVTNVNGGDQANAVAIQDDNRILVAGIAVSDGADIDVVRYMPDGSLDGSFGSGGKVITGVTPGRTDFANDMVLQTDGRILVGGATNKGANLDDEFAMVRYNYDGSLDAGFGDGGKVVTDIGPKSDGINGLALLTDGRIVAVGKTLDATDPFPSRIAVARYLADGTLDTAFAGDGTAVTAVGSSNDEAADVVVQADGKIVAAGYSATGVEDTRFVAVRYDSDGTPLIQPGGGSAGTSDTAGYWLTASDGGIFSYGKAAFYGSTGNIRLAKPIVGMAPTRSGRGYWLVASDGGIFSYGDAAFFGSTGDIRLNRPIVGMAPTPSGKGYWLVASDGGIFSYGDARFLGSTGDIRLVQPIVAMAATPSGNGYWLTASDGGIFAFGDARFLGSTGNIRLVKPIVAMAPTRSGQGYWLTASDGGIFAFGDARFLGSTGNIRLVQPIVGMTATKTGQGYWMVASDGGIFAFGDAPFLGSTGAIRLAKPIIGMAGL